MSEPLLDNEKALLLDIDAGDEQAFRYIFEAYHGKLYHYLLRLTDSKETAQDIVHDVFLKIWQQKQLSVVQNFNAYLYRMAHNRAYNSLRHLAVKKLALAKLEAVAVSPANDIESRYAAKEVRLFINEQVKKLTPQQQAVFRMSRDEGFKNDEIATALGISVFTVKKHLTNALNFLRNAIAVSFENNNIVVCLASALFLQHRG